jgi:hypothetical protein
VPRPLLDLTVHPAKIVVSRAARDRERERRSNDGQRDARHEHRLTGAT